MTFNDFRKKVTSSLTLEYSTKFLKVHNRLPTGLELSKLTGFHHSTCKRYLKEIKGLHPDAKCCLTPTRIADKELIKIVSSYIESYGYMPSVTDFGKLSGLCTSAACRRLQKIRKHFPGVRKPKLSPYYPD